MERPKMVSYVCATMKQIYFFLEFLFEYGSLTFHWTKNLTMKRAKDISSHWIFGKLKWFGHFMVLVVSDSSGFMNALNAVAPAPVKKKRRSSDSKVIPWNGIFQYMCICSINPLNANFTKWSNTLKQFIGNLPTNCLSVFDHFVGLVLRGLMFIESCCFFTFLKGNISCGHLLMIWSTEILAL